MSLLLVLIILPTLFLVGMGRELDDVFVLLWRFRRVGDVGVVGVRVMLVLRRGSFGGGVDVLPAPPLPSRPLKPLALKELRCKIGK
jgi:hypothetical protein